jgi:RNA polymerase sigma-70 factor (ECF subfamily)
MMDQADQLYERVLVLRCQAGDEAAFAELLGRYQARLRYYVRKMLGVVQGTDDVLQDVWLDVFRGVARLSDPGAFPAWVYRIARARVARVLRRSRPPVRPLDEDDLVGSAEDGEEFTAEDAGRVHAALDQLSPEHREVLVLRFLEGMSYEAIARVTGGQLGTVRSRLHYAKRALRGVLERTNLHD